MTVELHPNPSFETNLLAHPLLVPIEKKSAGSPESLSDFLEVGTKKAASLSSKIPGFLHNIETYVQEMVSTFPSVSYQPETEKFHIRSTAQKLYALGSAVVLAVGASFLVDRLPQVWNYVSQELIGYDLTDSSRLSELLGTRPIVLLSSAALPASLVFFKVINDFLEVLKKHPEWNKTLSEEKSIELSKDDARNIAITAAGVAATYVYGFKSRLVKLIMAVSLVDRFILGQEKMDNTELAKTGIVTGICLAAQASYPKMRIFKDFTSMFFLERSLRTNPLGAQDFGLVGLGAAGISLLRHYKIIRL